MGKTAILSLRIIGDAVGGVAALDQTDQAAGRMQAGMQRASVGAGVALTAIGAMAVSAGNAASEAEQAVGGIDAVFGQYSDRMKGYADEAAQTVGLSSTEYNTLATVLGSQLKNMGLDLDAAASKTQDLVGMGSDLAAQFGGTTSEAVSALSSLLRGERDPIERYGVSINQAAVDAELAALGLEGLTGEAEKNANLQATLSILTRQTADAQGAFGREADTAAGAQQRANAEWQNAIAALGESLLPLMSQGAELLAMFAGIVGENTEAVTIIVAVIALLAAGILAVNGALTAYQAVQAVATAATWASNAAWLANPITWVVLLIVALIAIIITLVANWDEVTRVAGIAGDKVAESWDTMTRGAIQVWDWIKRVGDALANIGSGGLGGVWDAISAPFSMRMAVSPEIDTSQTMFRSMAVAEAPQARTMSTFATTSSVPSSSALGSFRQATPAPAPVNVNVTFTGLVTDPAGVAKQIRGVLRDYDRATGRTSAGGDF